MINTSLEFLQSVSNFFQHYTKPDGSLTCFKHHLEHTGKNIYGAFVDMTLYEQTGEERYFDQAKQRVLYTTTKLVDDNSAKVFWPGRLHKMNMSNSVIDSGACSDVLATFLRKYQNRLTDDEQKQIWSVVEQNCDTYLMKACVGKEYTNQRLWGATGLASAYMVEQKPAWKEALQASLRVSFNDMHADGSIPYTTKIKEHNLHAGVHDTTPYYHSRHIAFMLHVVDALGEESDMWFEKLKPMTEFLIAMYQQNGLKSMHLEAKRWYFLNPYEVASHSYDVNVFLRYFEKTKDMRYAYYAKLSTKQLFKHAFRVEGGIDDHVGGVRNFQCPFFWNSHVAWFARVVKGVGHILEEDIQKPQPSVTFFPNADVIRSVKETYAFTVRGKKQAMSLLVGPPVGGGSIIYFGSKQDGFKNILAYFEWDQSMPLTFSLRSGTRSLGYIKKNLVDFRALAFFAKVELLARDWGSLWYRIKEIGSKLWYQDTLASSAFFCAPLVKYKDDTVTYTSALANRAGSLVEGVTLTRTYEIQEKELNVRERVQIDRPVGNITFHLHEALEDLAIEGTIQPDRTDASIIIPSGVGEITITYTLR